MREVPHTAEGFGAARQSESGYVEYRQPRPGLGLGVEKRLEEQFERLEEEHQLAARTREIHQMAERVQEKREFDAKFSELTHNSDVKFADIDSKFTVELKGIHASLVDLISGMKSAVESPDESSMRGALISTSLPLEKQ